MGWADVPADCRGLSSRRTSAVSIGVNAGGSLGRRYSLVRRLAPCQSTLDMETADRNIRRDPFCLRRGRSSLTAAIRQVSR